MAITAADFFVSKEEPDAPWGGHRIEDVLGRERLTALIGGRDPMNPIWTSRWR